MRDPQWYRIVMGMKPIPNYPNHSHEDTIRANCESGVHRGCVCQPSPPDKDAKAFADAVVDLVRRLYGLPGKSVMSDNNEGL